MWFPCVYQVTCWATCRAKLYHPMDLFYWTAEQSHHNGAIDCGAVVPFSLCYSDWLTESYHFPCVILIGRLDRTTLTCYSHWMLLLDVSQMFLSAVLPSTQQAALTLP